MVAFGHTAIGVIIGVTSYHFLGSGDLATGLITTGAVGVTSHYLADLMPHGHFFRHLKYKSSILWVIIFDVFLSVALFLGFSHFLGKNIEQILYIFFGIGGSQLPDVLDGLIYMDLLPKKSLLKMENRFHQWTHWHGKNEHALLWSYTDIWQILTVVLALLILLKY